jgi:hypothetical protein
LRLAADTAVAFAQISFLDNCMVVECSCTFLLIRSYRQDELKANWPLHALRKSA